MKNYSEYVNQFGNALQSLSLLRKERSEFKQFLKKTRKNKKLNGLDLPSYLIMPGSIPLHLSSLPFPTLNESFLLILLLFIYLFFEQFYFSAKYNRQLREIIGNFSNLAVKRRFLSAPPRSLFIYLFARLFFFNVHLIAAVQRIPRYVMLLKELQKYTWAEHPDARDLNKALDKVSEIANVVNESKRKAEQYKEVHEIASRLKKLPKGLQLLQAHRRYRRRRRMGLMKIILNAFWID
tara:strand:- start:1035 stop:1745 length:711 start_codon:yes stop_codon:yes gene_type:complete